jgi:long-chain acyl-CoA synthetase
MRFVNLHKEFDPDEAEITRTAKIKRTLLEDKYIDIVGAIYIGERELTLATAVKYRDGRQGQVKATVYIEDVG